MARKDQPGYQPGDEVALTAKEKECLDLRIAGKTYDEIARIIGYANAGGAYKAVQRAMHATLQEPADELRRLERERLDSLFDLAFARAREAQGDASMRAIDRCLSIQARRAALDGLDAPFRIEERVITEDAIDAEIRRLEQQMRDNDPERVAQ